MNDAKPPRPVVVLISGRGGNMRALIEDSRVVRPRRPYDVVLVVSDKPGAAGLQIARDVGIATRSVAVDRSLDRPTYDRTLAAVIDDQAFSHTPPLIVLAGFMRILSAEFVARYAGRILNIHPSLLPKYPGLHTHRRAIAARDAAHGATVHFVTAELDAGPAIIQARVTIAPDDDEATLASKVQAVEHRIYPMAVRWYCEGRLRCRDGAAWLDGNPLLQPVLYDDTAGR